MTSPLRIHTDEGYWEAVTAHNKLAEGVLRYRAAIDAYESSLPLGVANIQARFRFAWQQRWRDRVLWLVAGALLAVIVMLF